MRIGDGSWSWIRDENEKKRAHDTTRHSQRRWYNKGNETSSLSCGERFRSNAPHWKKMRRASRKGERVRGRERERRIIDYDIACKRTSCAAGQGRLAKMRSICFSCYFIRSKNNTIPFIHNHGRMQRIQVNPSNRFVHYWLIMDRKHNRKKQTKKANARTNETNEIKKKYSGFWCLI